MGTDSKLRNAVGLAMKAGKLQSGDFIVERLVRGGDAKLVLLDETASANTRDKYARMCQAAHTVCLPVQELGPAIGKPGRMVAAVIEQQFSDMIRRAFSQQGAAEEVTRG